MSRKTNIFEKSLASFIDVTIIFLLSAPIVLILSINKWQLLTIGIFFLYNVLFLLFNRNRSLGMIIVGVEWAKAYSMQQKVIWLILYTASFSTLLIWIWFPFDLFLINMLLLQLPSILVTGTTFHGLISGRMETVKLTNNQEI